MKVVIVFCFCFDEIMEDGVVDVGSEEKMEVLSDMVVDKVFIKV